MNVVLKAAMGLFFSTTVVSPSVFAGQEELNAAKGVIMIDYTLEKCTNQETPDDIIKKQAKALRSQGVTAKEIEQGFQQGMMQVELAYPRNKKPSKSECDKARYLYNEFLKVL
jgi:hypothetical protein